MAEFDAEQDDRTEATPERREDFRERGQVVQSRELSQILVLAACVIFLTYYAPKFTDDLQKMFTSHFQRISQLRVSPENILNFLSKSWLQMLFAMIPLYVCTAIIATLATLVQTQFNWSWKRLAPEFAKLNPLSGLKRMVSPEAFMELFKSLAKMFAVGAVAYLILLGEWKNVPGLMYLPFTSSWQYLGSITKQLVWGITALLLFIAAADYIFNFVSLERKMKMTKQEVKEEIKQREADPHVKARLKRMAREIANRRTLEKTKAATVLITNPTHFSIAVKYELGMTAPVVVAKGVDFLALRMREIAKELDIPIVENKPLARAMYDQVKEGQEIPVSMYKAVSEVIRYIFKLKGVRVTRSNSTVQV